MEVPEVDYNKANLQWANRIAKEKSYSPSQSDSVQLISHGSVTSVQGKISNLPAPFVHRQRVLEFMNLREAAESNSPIFPTSFSPRLKFLLPQSSSQDLGWSLSGQFPTMQRKREVEQKGTITGLYNSKNEVSRSNSVPRRFGHTLGYVTLVGVDSHPRKGIRGSIRSPKAKTEADDTCSEDGPDIPGDFHMRPHEWARWQSQLVPRHESVKFDYSKEENPCASNTSGLSVPTTVIREADRNVSRGIEKQRQFMNRIGSNKWFRPLNSNEVSAYGDAYVRSMGTGPFSKTQLLVSR